MSHENDKNLADHGWGKVSVLAEMAKCEIVCSNCHRKEHHRDGAGTEDRTPTSALEAQRARQYAIPAFVLALPG